MSASPENELDLEKLFLPAWAQEPPSAKHYAQYEANDTEARERKGDRRGRRPPGRDKGFGDRPPGRRRPDDGRPGQRGRPFERRAPFQKEGGGAPRGEPRDREPLPLPEIHVLLLPEQKGVESLARQIKTTGRAYPLFDIARLILQKPDRYAITFKVKKKPDGQVAQPLFVCALDDTLWLDQNEAVAHVLKNHFATFYQTERTATEPPKGKYTFVAQCGMSGVILGPPNYHDYQNQLRRLHAERFSRMPFEVFKSRVKIVRDEEVVKKWIDDQSWRTEYICLNLPEPLRLGSPQAVEAHFKEVHQENIIKPVESHTLSGTAARSQRCRELTRLVRHVWEDQKRFPLQIATALSQQFAGLGLQFFKVNRAITHVSVARPHFLDLETTPVSDGVRRIVEFINAHPKCTRRRLFESLAPAPPPPAAPPTEPDNTPPQAQSETQPATAPTESAPAAATPAPSPAHAAEPTPEQTAVVADLHWLIHQGHVIEFANGILDTAKKPIPKPPKAQPKPPKSPEAPAAESAGPADATSAPEQAPETAAIEPIEPAPELEQPEFRSAEGHLSGANPAGDTQADHSASAGLNEEQGPSESSQSKPGTDSPA